MISADRGELRSQFLKLHIHNPVSYTATSPLIDPPGLECVWSIQPFGRCWCQPCKNKAQIPCPTCPFVQYCCAKCLWADQVNHADPCRQRARKLEDIQVRFDKTCRTGPDINRIFATALYLSDEKGINVNQMYLPSFANEYVHPLTFALFVERGLHVARYLRWGFQWSAKETWALMDLVMTWSVDEVEMEAPNHVMAIPWLLRIGLIQTATLGRMQGLPDLSWEELVKLARELQSHGLDLSRTLLQHGRMHSAMLDAILPSQLAMSSDKIRRTEQGNHNSVQNSARGRRRKRVRRFSSGGCRDGVRKLEPLVPVIGLLQNLKTARSEVGFLLDQKRKREMRQIEFRSEVTAFRQTAERIQEEQKLHKHKLDEERVRLDEERKSFKRQKCESIQQIIAYLWNDTPSLVLMCTRSPTMWYYCNKEHDCWSPSEYDEDNKHEWKVGAPEMSLALNQDTDTATKCEYKQGGKIYVVETKIHTGVSQRFQTNMETKKERHILSDELTIHHQGATRKVLSYLRELTTNDPEYVSHTFPSMLDDFLTQSFREIDMTYIRAVSIVTLENVMAFVQCVHRCNGIIDHQKNNERVSFILTWHGYEHTPIEKIMDSGLLPVGVKTVYGHGIYTSTSPSLAARSYSVKREDGKGYQTGSVVLCLAAIYKPLVIGDWDQVTNETRGMRRVNGEIIRSIFVTNGILLQTFENSVLPLAKVVFRCEA